MRKFVLLICSFVSLGLHAQVTNTMNNASTPVEEAEMEAQPDTTYVVPAQLNEQKEERAPSVRGAMYKKKAAEKAKDYDKSANESPAPSAATAMEAQKVSGSFTYSKKQSALQRTQRSPSQSQQMDMDNAVDYFEKNAPNSFEYHYFKYVSGNYDVSLISHLKKAEKMRPNNSDVQVQMAAYHMIKNNVSDAKGYMEKLKASKRLTDVSIYYAKDILYSVPDSGVLITHGFDDTYAAWYDQQVKGIRKDVHLISLDFLQSKAYRTQLVKDGFTMPSSTTINVNYLKEFCRLNSGKGISISLTTPKEYFKPIEDKLYVTGLVFEYHTEEFNNFDRNEKLWNTDLDKYLVNSSTNEKGKKLTSNYLPMLFQLRAVYTEKGLNDKKAAVDKAIDKIAVQCKKYEQVQQLKRAY